MDSQAIEALIREYSWMFLCGAGALFFRGAIENFVSGLIFYLGSDYNVDDEVYIGGTKKARIVRQNFSKTVFYMEGTHRRLIVENRALNRMGIEKVLPSEPECSESEN